MYQGTEMTLHLFGRVTYIRLEARASLIRISRRLSKSYIPLNNSQMVANLLSGRPIIWVVFQQLMNVSL